MMDEQSRELLDRVRAVVEERDALRADVERLRALPVIATCGACGYESPSADAAGDVCNVCTHSGPNQWQPVRVDKAPPTWCQLRGAR